MPPSFRNSTYEDIKAWAEATFPSAFAIVLEKTARSHLWYGSAGPLDNNVYENAAGLSLGMYISDETHQYGAMRWQLYAVLRKDGGIDFIAAKYLAFNTLVHHVTNAELHTKCEFRFFPRANFIIDSEADCVRRLKSQCMFLFLKSDQHPITTFKTSTYIKKTFFKESCEKVEQAVILGIYDKRASLSELGEFMLARQHTVVVPDETTEEAA